MGCVGHQPRLSRYPEGSDTHRGLLLHVTLSASHPVRHPGEPHTPGGGDPRCTSYVQPHTSPGVWGGHAHIGESRWAWVWRVMVVAFVTRHATRSRSTTNCLIVFWFRPSPIILPVLFSITRDRLSERPFNFLSKRYPSSVLCEDGVSFLGAGVVADSVFVDVPRWRNDNAKPLPTPLASESQGASHRAGEVKEAEENAQAYPKMYVKFVSRSTISLHQSTSSVPRSSDWSHHKPPRVRSALNTTSPAINRRFVPRTRGIRISAVEGCHWPRFTVQHLKASTSHTPTKPANRVSGEAPACDGVEVVPVRLPHFPLPMVWKVCWISSETDEASRLQMRGLETGPDKLP